MPLARRRPLAGLAALGAAALIAGCGGGSGSLSADEFREQADAICADADERLETLTEPTAAGEILPFLRAGLPIQAEELGRIEELDPPDELQAAVDEAGELNQQRQELIQRGRRPHRGRRGPPGGHRRGDAGDRAPAGGGAGEGAGTGAHGLRPRGRRGHIHGRRGDRDRPRGDDRHAPGRRPARRRRGETAQYLEDVGAAVASLRSFSSLLQGTTSLEDLQARVPEARAELDSFDDAVAELEGYSFDNATLEAQRAELAESGPRVSDQLRRFLTAAESGDAEAIQAVLPGVTQALTEFQDAATP